MGVAGSLGRREIGSMRAVSARSAQLRLPGLGASYPVRAGRRAGLREKMLAPRGIAFEKSATQTDALDEYREKMHSLQANSGLYAVRS